MLLSGEKLVRILSSSKNQQRMVSVAMEITCREILSQIHGDHRGTEVTVFCDCPTERIMLRDGRVQDALALMDRLEKALHARNCNPNSVLGVVGSMKEMNSYNPQNR